MTADSVPQDPRCQQCDPPGSGRECRGGLCAACDGYGVSPEHLVVTQEDRDAQARMYLRYGQPGSAWEVSARQEDDHPGVRNYAAHRILALHARHREAASD